MLTNRIWIQGESRSGKTFRLVKQFKEWIDSGKLPKPIRQGFYRHVTPNILILAANDDNRYDLADRLVKETNGRYPIQSKTPFGFFQDEVFLFFPILIEKLQIKAHFPLKLRPETEQDLATQFWHEELVENPLFDSLMLNEYRLVRRILDLWQLAALSGINIADISTILSQGFPEIPEKLCQSISILLSNWREWCLKRGVLSYSLIYELYWRYLLPDIGYKEQLKQRYQGILADDVDDYPAITRDLFEVMLNQDAFAIFSYNSYGLIRLGLNADPDYLSGIKKYCQVENLTANYQIYIDEVFSGNVIQKLNEMSSFPELPPEIQAIQTVSRGELLRQTAETIINLVKKRNISPDDIAIIAPGFDAIALYALTDILTKNHINVHPLNEQKPLINSPLIRALLTLLVLVYPNLGRLIDQEAIAEMLVVLSQKQSEDKLSIITSEIDPVRAGLISDHCYVPDAQNPHLLPVTEFARWDRLGYQSTTAYNHIFSWIETQRSPQQQHLLTSFLILLDRAIQTFFFSKINLSYEDLSSLRELMETAQHYTEIDKRLREIDKKDVPNHIVIGKFIQLLKMGTITANSYPVRKIGAKNAVTLATIFQYRSARTFHKYHFWLDVGSNLWLSSGVSNLFASNLFLKNWHGKPFLVEDGLRVDNERLERILKDLLCRVGESIYLCHSELGTNGQEQMGILSSLINSTF